MMSDQNDISEHSDDQEVTLDQALLLGLNDAALCQEEAFNHSMNYAIYQPDPASKKAALQEAASELLIRLNRGYILNLNNDRFIQDILILFQHEQYGVCEKLLDKLPIFLKLILKYHLAQDVPPHFWIEALKSQISIIDFMQSFNMQISKTHSLLENLTTLEPYCVALDAALQQFNFDTGEKVEGFDIFTHLVRAKAVYLAHKRVNSEAIQDRWAFLGAYPEEYRFFVETAILIDYGSFINGLENLRSMVFGGPSDQFIKAVTEEIRACGAYNLPLTDAMMPLPQPSVFYTLPACDFHVPFKFEEVKTKF